MLFQKKEYPINYVHGYVVLCFVIVKSYFLMYLFDYIPLFTSCIQKYPIYSELHKEIKLHFQKEYRKTYSAYHCFMTWKKL